MKWSLGLSRRSFLAASAAAPFVAAVSAEGRRIPVGLELYSVRNELKQDLPGTLRAVAKMGYEGVEFYAPYFEWTPAYAKDVRKVLDDVGMRCFSTHNGPPSFGAAGLPHAIELNQTLGSKFIVMASAGKVSGIDGWKRVAETLNQGAAAMKPAGLRAGYHNHDAELKPIDGQLPLEVLAAGTGKEVTMQMDVGPFLELKLDPVEWIRRNPGRIHSMHVKEWSQDKGFQALLGEGAGSWKQILDAARTTGGLEYALIEQEGSSYTPFETAEKCLAAYRKIMG